jgi:hypothetical protein
VEEAEACLKLLGKRKSDELPDDTEVDEELTTLQQLEKNRKRRKVQASRVSVEYVDVGKLMCHF